MWVDIKVRSSERGREKFADNGELTEVLSRVIAKFGVRSTVFQKVLDYETEKMVP